MSISLDTMQMLHELIKADVDVDFSDQLTKEEEYNKIIHEYDITFLTVGWKFQQETAEICCANKINNQPWKKAYRA